MMLIVQCVVISDQSGSSSDCVREMFCILFVSLSIVDFSHYHRCLSLVHRTST